MKKAFLTTILVLVWALLPTLTSAEEPPEFILKWGSFGIADGEFEDPSDVTTDLFGNVYVADTRNDRIQKFTSDGTFLTKWGSFGTGDGQFNNPHHLTVSADGYVYVVEFSNHRIQKFTSDGTFLAKWGSFGTGDGQFNYPRGIYVDVSGNIYVADQQNYRIQKFGYTFVTLALDVRPAVCPNTINQRSGGIFWAALLGKTDFDVQDIDLSTVVLEDSIAPISSQYVDVSTPAPDTVECDCTTDGPDGFGDLRLKFSIQELISALGPVSAGDTVTVNVTGMLLDGTAFQSGDCVVIIGNPAPKITSTIPSEFSLSSYPNPLNPVTTINFSLPEASYIRLEVFNLLGQQVKTLTEGFHEAGNYSVEWDAGHHSSGIYFYRLQTNEAVRSQKMLLLK